MYDLMWQNETLWKKQAGPSTIPVPPEDPPILKAALLLWEEHCIECAPPDCYSSCSLYVSRRDQKCARFVYGIFPNVQVVGLFEYGADILLRRWAKIEANFYGSPKLYPIEAVRTYDRLGRALGRIVNVIGDALESVNPKRRVNGLYTLLRSKWIANRFACRDGKESKVEALYMKFFYPGNRPIELQIEVVQSRPVFRDRIDVAPGWNEKIIPFGDMQLIPNQQGRISLWSGDDEEVRLIFTWLDFVSFESSRHSLSSVKIDEGTSRSPASKVKCLVWDLDDTLWEGIIGEVGPENVRPRDGAIEVIKRLDERGIMHSVASKNTHEIVWPKIEQLGLADYFLYPAINWGRKSESIRKIAAALNIHLDTLAVIDDSAFERGEILATLPEVRVYTPDDIAKVEYMEEFNVPVTKDSRQRRLSYLAEANRKEIAASWGDDYEGFLRSCEIHILISVLSSRHKDRCLELIQRTNQLNLSARRYSEEEFDRLLKTDQIECYAIDCWDKYGTYGTIGFASVDVSVSAPTIKDLIFSCRVAQKRVDEAFLCWCAQRVQRLGSDRVRAVFVSTDRNMPLREVLERFPFRVVGTDGNVHFFEFTFSGPICLPDVVKIEEALI